MTTPSYTCPNCCGTDVALVDCDGLLEGECNDCDYFAEIDEFAWSEGAAA